jgi:glycosyltransferase involved in cell wall biosynthesis
MNEPTPAKKLLVSIGMPVFNGEKFVADALKSLLAQTYSNFELIITDNASTDRTGEICREFAAKDSRVRYVLQQENIGPGANFKAALDAAIGNYFMWAAHDDLWERGHVQDAVELLADSKVDFVFPTFEVQSVRWRVRKKYDPKFYKFIESPERQHRVLSFMSLHYLSYSANIVYSMFRRDFLHKVWETQDITNDGVFGAVVVSRGAGILGRSLFKKRYAGVWPGKTLVMINNLMGRINGVDVVGQANDAIVVARIQLQQLFPEYDQEIAYIFARYKPYLYGEDYRVCSLPPKSG